MFSISSNEYTLVMDRITATACFFDNRNGDVVVNMTTTTATAVIFSTTANILRNFYTISYFIYVKVKNCNYVIATYYFFLIVY